MLLDSSYYEPSQNYLLFCDVDLRCNNELTMTLIMLQSNECYASLFPDEYARRLFYFLDTFLLLLWTILLSRIENRTIGVTN